MTHQIIKDLNWRHSTKKYDVSKKVSKEDYDNLKLACKPIFQKIETLYEKASIEVEGKHFDLYILMFQDLHDTCIDVPGNFAF
jgi:hypothetical protein